MDFYGIINKIHKHIMRKGKSNYTTEKQEEFLRKQLEYFVSDNIRLHAKAFD